MHLVPANNVEFLPSSLGEYFFCSYGRQVFITGSDSPVIIASFIKHDPVSRMASHGICKPSSISIMSPGTKRSEDIFFFLFDIASQILLIPPVLYSPRQTTRKQRRTL